MSSPRSGLANSKAKFIFNFDRFVFCGSEWGFTLAKQALYYLSHIYSPFCSGYFGDGGLHYWPKLTSNCDTSDLIHPPKKKFF
jgi:hypothetical protein